MGVFRKAVGDTDLSSQEDFRLRRGWTPAKGTLRDRQRNRNSSSQRSGTDRHEGGVSRGPARGEPRALGSAVGVSG